MTSYQYFIIEDKTPVRIKNKILDDALGLLCPVAAEIYNHKDQCFDKTLTAVNDVSNAFIVDEVSWSDYTKFCLKNGMGQGLKTPL